MQHEKSSSTEGAPVDVVATEDSPVPPSEPSIVLAGDNEEQDKENARHLSAAAAAAVEEVSFETKAFDSSLVERLKKRQISYGKKPAVVVGNNNNNNAPVNPKPTPPPSISAVPATETPSPTPPSGNRSTADEKAKTTFQPSKQEKERLETAAKNMLAQLHELSVTDRPPVVPPYLTYNAETRTFRTSAKALAPYPELRKLYLMSAKMYSMRAQLVVEATKTFNENISATLSCGWLSNVYVWTPPTFVVLQGPLENPRTPEEQDASEIPAVIPLSTLYTYYYSLTEVLSAVYNEAARESPAALKRFQETAFNAQVLGQQFTDSFESKRAAAAGRLLVDAKKLVHDTTPLPLLPLPVEASRPLKDFVDQSLSTLRKFAADQTLYTLTLILVQETMIQTLLGFASSTADEDVVRVSRINMAVPSLKFLGAQKALTILRGQQTTNLIQYAYRLTAMGSVEGEHIFATLKTAWFLAQNPTETEEERYKALEPYFSDDGVLLPLVWMRCMMWLRHRKLGGNHGAAQ